MIPTGNPWGYSGYSAYDGYPSNIPEGVAKYIGIRFDQGAGYQYGWIGVVRTGHELEAFAWGYETDPGVPIEAGAESVEPGPIPTVSEWGMATMGLLILAAGTIVWGKGTGRAGEIAS